MFGFLDGIKVTLIAILIGVLSISVADEGMDSFIYFIVLFGLYAFIFGVYKQRKG
ncbi:MAG: hypothetical protein HQL46_14690 [Gammaproteobacteria bacterium]|nr:hypothetical protein [Gammaproteobacteria bacterium]